MPVEDSTSTDKPAVRLQPEEVVETPPAQPAATPPPPVATQPSSPDSWSKFPPQVENTDNSGKSSKGLLLIVIILLMLALGVVGLIVYKARGMSIGKSLVKATPTPTQEAVATPEPTTAPTPAITDKSVVRVQVLNGSGVIGQAGKVATALVKDEFNQPDTGNYTGDKQTATTVNYSPKVDKSLVDEVVSVLSKSLTDVSASQDATLTNFDIQIVTGPNSTP